MNFETQVPSTPPPVPHPPVGADGNLVWLIGSITALLSIGARYLYKYLIEPWWQQQNLRLVMSLSQERRIINALAQILLILKADRCLLLQFNNGIKPHPTIICSSEICAPGVSEISPLVSRSNRCTSKCYEILSKAKTFNYRSVDEVQSIEYRNFLLSIGVKRLVSLPIRLEELFLGCIIVHWTEHNETYEWSFQKIERQFAIVSDTLLSIELAGKP